MNDAPPPYPGMGPQQPQAQFYQAPPAANGLAYPQQPGFAYPHVLPAGFVYQQEPGYAYANGNQAYVPASAPPPTYDEASKKFN